jgi:hypothetical protein
MGGRGWEGRTSADNYIAESTERRRVKVPGNEREVLIGRSLWEGVGRVRREGWRKVINGTVTSFRAVASPREAGGH